MLTGNDFIGTTSLVLRAVDGDLSATRQLEADLSGCYFETAVESEVRALIDDTQAGFDPGTHEGGTIVVPFSTVEVATGIP